MREIPEDILQTAERVWEIAWENYQGDHDADPIGVIARAIAAERERIATSLFNRPAFMLAVAGDGKPYVKIEFGTLKEMQAFHGELVGLSKHKAAA